MYLTSDLACNLTNSATPLSQKRLRDRARSTAWAARAMERGNQTLDDIMASLTPPAATPSAGALQNSFTAFENLSPFPEPGGGPAPTVEIRTPAQTENWIKTWADQAAAALRNANWGTLTMPTIGGGIPGASSWPPTALPTTGEPNQPGAGQASAGQNWPAGFQPGQAGTGPNGAIAGNGLGPNYGYGSSKPCVLPEVLPLQNVFPQPDNTADVSPGTPATVPGKLSGLQLLALLALGAGAVVLANADGE